MLRRFAFQANQTARLGNPDAVHDLRVSIRRLSQCLKVFRQFLPHGKKIRRKLSGVIHLASQVRDRDIALGLLAAARIPRGSPLGQALALERAAAERSLAAELEHWSRRGFHNRWRSRLGL